MYDHQCVNMCQYLARLHTDGIKLLFRNTVQYALQSGYLT